jgi:hypothetical protein
MTTRCPSDLALERHLLDPSASPHLAHVEACPVCHARLARMQQEGDDFRRYVFPATVERVEDAAARARRRWFPLVLAPVGGLVAIAAALLVVVRVPTGPAEGYTGIKGAPITLSVFTADGGGVHALHDGAAVPPAAALRFKVKAKDCSLWLFSVDQAGAVTRLFPAEGGAAAVPPAGGELPGGVVLDGVAGPERVYAVCSDQPLPWADVERAARQAAGGGAERVRAGGMLALPEHASQATLLLEKRP